ncbi:unnamed protein product [Rotaria sp. Silwood1]|nr:unnamed protein product [Rotaria sp. Silwood1]CAF1628535.1 unnamed protein product [Rotaria sp. Silwood1]
MKYVAPADWYCQQPLQFRSSKSICNNGYDDFIEGIVILLAASQRLNDSLHAYKQAHVCIITVADPISRSEYIQEHKLSVYSLNAVVSISIQTNHIIESIKICTLGYGKVKLVLKYN